MGSADGQASRSRLAELCVAHVAEEERILRAVRDALLQSRDALRGGDAAAQETAARAQEEATRAAEEMRARRHGFLQHAAELVNLPPHTLTLRRLAEHLDRAIAEEVLRGRERLMVLAGEIERLRQANAALLYYCLDFMHRFVRDLTGRPGPVRYGPGGKLHEPAGGSLLEARG